VRAETGEVVGVGGRGLEVQGRGRLARCERQQRHVTLGTGGVAVVAAAEADDRAPQLGFAAGHLLQQSGQGLGIPAALRRRDIRQE